MIIQKYFFLLSALSFLTDLHASDISSPSQATPQELLQDLGPTDKYHHLNFPFLEPDGNTAWNQLTNVAFERKKLYEAQQAQLIALRKAAKSPTATTNNSKEAQ